MSEIVTKYSIFCVLIAFLSTSKILAQTESGPSLTQITIPLGENKPFRYWSDAKARTITLEIQKISPNQIEGLDDYDEAFIRRLRMRDLGGSATEIVMTLRDDKSMATINYFDEPPRLVIELFPRIQKNLRDPITGYPLSFDRSLSELPAGANITPPVQMQDKATASPKQNSELQSGQPVQKLMLQSSNFSFHNADELVAAMNQTPDGFGPFWKEYPSYIYRLQTSLFENATPDRDFVRKQSGSAVKSAEALADYAGRLFDFGHEGKSLIAYQGVLREDSAVFQKNPLHLWRFAEAHFSHGNLTLAEGYFQLLIDKFPGHPLSPYAQMRRLDIECVRSLQKNADASLANIASKIDRIQPKASSELQSQLAIRTGFWTGQPQNDQVKEGKSLPIISDVSRINLQNSLPAVENSKTAFLGYSLVLNAQCKGDPNWSTEMALNAQNYFKRFSGTETEPHRSNLSECVKSKLENHIATLYKEGNFARIVEDFSALPTSMQSVSKNPTVAWNLGESFRQMGQNQNAAKYYEQSAQVTTASDEKLRSLFWAMNSLQTENQALRATPRSQASIDQNQRRITKLDKDSVRMWESVDREKRDALYSSMRVPLEKGILRDDDKTVLPAMMILDQWTKMLSTERSMGSDQSPGGAQMVSSGAASLQLIVSLSKRFQKLGKENERQQSIALLKQIKPSSFGDDQVARKLWADQLYSLANEYRESNKVLDAAKLYAQAGSEAGSWDRRAESLYRGGLLLLRSGQKQEATEALRKASEDQNNLFYANLAKERLNQIAP